jgi:hypothetical protein
MEREITIQFGIIKKAALADLLYSKVNELEDEGEFQPTYAPIIDRIFNTHNQKKLLQTDTEILLTNMYVLRKESFHGIDVNKTNEIGWFYPKNVS